MRKLIAAAMMAAGAATLAAPAAAADLPEYPDIEIPEVDYGIEGSFYLRGSAGLNLLWSREHIGICGVVCAPVEGAGYGYSVGAGIGYETGSGVRFDGTIDWLSNDGLTDGTNELHLRSAIALANVYYDFPLSGMGSLGGGFGAYVGAGIGGARYWVSTTPADVDLPDGEGWTAAAAAMAGVSYDMGSMVADLGYRFIYLPQLSNNALGPDPSWYLNDNTVHEIQASLRYRLQ
jgi:opacity protein-like surface antigen